MKKKVVLLLVAVQVKHSSMFKVKVNSVVHVLGFSIEFFTFLNHTW